VKTAQAVGLRALAGDQPAEEAAGAEATAMKTAQAVCLRALADDRPAGGTAGMSLHHTVLSLQQGLVVVLDVLAVQAAKAVELAVPPGWKL